MRRFAHALTFAALLLSGTASADTADRPVQFYRASWGGLHAADILMETRNENGQYRTDMQIDGYGLVRAFFRLNIIAGASGKMPAKDTTDPLKYSADVASRWGRRLLQVEYDPQSRIATQTRDEQLAGPDPDLEPDAEILKPIPPEMRINVLDPLSIIPSIRRLMREGKVPDHPRFVTINIFDGRRRYDLEISIRGKGQHDIDRVKTHTIDLHLTYKALAGFREKYRVMWDNTPFTLYLSDDGRFRPLRLINDSFPIPTVITLIAECDSAEACRKDHGS